MSTQVEIESIEALDFEYTPPCEHSEHGIKPTQHSGPAWALVRSRCPGCDLNKTLYICETVWASHAPGKAGLRHRACGWRGPRDEFWTLLSLVGDAQ